MCRFVRSLWDGDFELYVKVLDELCPWLFAFDHTNYARWVPVHVKDLVELPVKHPEVYEEFMKGNFVVQRSHGGRRSPVVACWASDHWVASSNLLRGKFRH